MAKKDERASEGSEDPLDASRRRFLKLSGAALGASAVTVMAGGILDKVIRFGAQTGLKPWETAVGVVDYGFVQEGVFTTNELRIAQWYDYWPGSFVANFQNYIQTKYNRSIRITIDVFTTNEELFTWITQSGRKFDVMFPSNYMVQIMDRAGLLMNLNPAWLPNLQNLADGVKTAYNGRTLGDFLTPTGTPYAFRQGTGRIAVPYQGGTTGLGYNTTVFADADIAELGVDVFRHSSWNGTTLSRRLGMLDDMREVLGLGFKAAGWDAQPGPDSAKTGVVGANGEFQWSQNETDPAHVGAAEAVLKNEMEPNLLGFNTQSQGPWMRDGQTYANQAWSGDLVYALRPFAQTKYPVNYIIPKQGGARWVDNATIHREARNLWLAHEFMNFFLDTTQGATITDWNLYATPNVTSYDILQRSPPGCSPGNCDYDPREDKRIYPDEADLARCDWQTDVGVDVTQNLYIPAWGRIRF